MGLLRGRVNVRQHFFRNRVIKPWNLFKVGPSDHLLLTVLFHINYAYIIMILANFLSIDFTYIIEMPIRALCLFLLLIALH